MTTTKKMKKTTTSTATTTAAATIKNKEGKILIDRIVRLRYHEPDYLDPSRAVYQVTRGKAKIRKSNDITIQYSYEFEIAAVPLHEDKIREDPEYYSSEFIGFINSSPSAATDQGSKFDGRYTWTKKGRNHPTYASNIEDVLGEYGFVFGEQRASKSKVPCVIAANLKSEKIDYQNTAKQTRIDISPFSNAIIETIEKVAKKISTFKTIGIAFESESRRKYRLTSRSRAITTTIKDVVEMMLLPRIQKVKSGEEITTEQTQDSLWYNALPLFEQYGVKYSNDSRQYFKTCIRELCKDHDIAREQIGIIAAPWASMFFNGEWFDISFDTVQSLSAKGTDIIFIEKRDIVRALGVYASQWGVALVNTHGHLSEYAEDLAELAEISGAHVAILTDYDLPGILIASKLRENVPRLGVDERMLTHFNITHANTEERRLVIPYSAKVQRMTEKNLQHLISKDKRFNSRKVVDIEFLKRNKIEIDAMLADQGAAKLWEYLQDHLEKEFKTRNYARVINPYPDLSQHYPPIVKRIQSYFDKRLQEITAEESKKIAEWELKDVEGFIDTKEKEKEIDERLAKIIREDPHLRDVAMSLEEFGRDRGYQF